VGRPDYADCDNGKVCRRCVVELAEDLGIVSGGEDW
jgi:hypothetical protein